MSDRVECSSRGLGRLDRLFTLLKVVVDLALVPNEPVRPSSAS